nr:unnamed protein product [Callosobruchus chinensis]
MEMTRGCDISGMNAVSCLIDGIEDTHVKTGAIAGRCAEPEALYSEYLSTLPSTSATSDHTTRNFLESGRKQSRDRMNPYVRNSTANEAKPNKSHVNCYNCGGQGHYVGQCSKPKKKCDKCNKYGHLPTECKVWKPTKTIKAVGTPRANLKVDKAEAPVDILVVPTEVQTVPLLNLERDPSSGGCLAQKLTLSEPSPVIREAMLKQYDGVCLRAFIRNLSGPLQTIIIRFKNPDSLETALSYLVDEQNFQYTQYISKHTNQRPTHSNFQAPRPSFDQPFGNNFRYQAPVQQFHQRFPSEPMNIQSITVQRNFPTNRETFEPPRNSYSCKMAPDST